MKDETMLPHPHLSPPLEGEEITTPSDSVCHPSLPGGELDAVKQGISQQREMKRRVMKEARLAMFPSNPPSPLYKGGNFGEAES